MSNRPINMLIDGFVYFYDTPLQGTSPMCDLIISTIASDYSFQNCFQKAKAECYLGMHP